MYHDLDSATSNWAADLLVTLSLASTDLDSNIAPRQLNIPKTYIVCKNDRIISPDSQYEQAKEAEATIVELESGHSAYLNEKHLPALADIIGQHAKL
jgi:hypothetical protein